MNDAEALAGRIDGLEMRIAYQDEVIEDLNRVVVEQWKQIDLLIQRLARLGDRIEALKYPAADPREEPPPPHY